MAFKPDDLLNGTYCLHEFSKDVDGQVAVVRMDRKTCASPGCESLVLVQRMKLTVRSAGCDGKYGPTLDGALRSADLTTVFTGPREGLRGVHAAEFFWSPSRRRQHRSRHAGGHDQRRPGPTPVHPGCEQCSESGLLTGHLFATGSNVPGIPVPDFNIEAVYRLRWDPKATIDAKAAVVGTLEGVIIMPCQ